MSKKIFTEEMLSYMKDNYLNMTYEDIAKELNKRYEKYICYWIYYLLKLNLLLITYTMNSYYQL